MSKYQSLNGILGKKKGGGIQWNTFTSWDQQIDDQCEGEHFQMENFNYEVQV